MKISNIYRMKRLTWIIVLIPLMAVSCKSLKQNRPDENVVGLLQTNAEGQGIELTVTFKKGKAHRFPLMAIWIEDGAGHFIETLYVSESIGKGVFKHGNVSKGMWMPGEVRRPAALPYWGHRRGVMAEDGLFIPTADNPLPDAVTGATPSSDFVVRTKLSDPDLTQFRLFFEINQPWEWNDYWTTTKFPDDQEYNTSGQPSVIYAVDIDTGSGKKEYEMLPIGHGHYSGKDGRLYTDLSTISTALQIADKIVISIP